MAREETAPVRDQETLLQEAIKLEPEERLAWAESLSPEEHAAMTEWAEAFTAALRETCGLLFKWASQMAESLNDMFRACELYVCCPDCQQTHEADSNQAVRCRCGTWLLRAHTDGWLALPNEED